MIVDTSALIAILKGEPEAARLLDALLSARNARISAASLVEARIVAERFNGTTQLEKLILQADIEVVPLDTTQADLAYEGFLRFGKGRHEAGLNYGDLFSYALARALREPLLFKGTDFAKTDIHPVV